MNNEITPIKYEDDFIVIPRKLLDSRIEEQRKQVNSSDIDSIYFEIQFLKALKALSFPAEEIWQATKVIETDPMTGFPLGNLFPTYEDFIKTKS